LLVGFVEDRSGVGIVMLLVCVETVTVKLEAS
jgi:hypothetical protein